MSLRIFSIKNTKFAFIALLQKILKKKEREREREKEKINA
jgi:hypothetical protein